MKFYLHTTEEVLAEIKSSADGLSTREAEKRLSEAGRNKLAKPKKASLVKRFLLQLADPMILILIAAATLSGVASAYAGESFADLFIILFVVLVNAALGVYQENKAEKALEALEDLTASSSRAIRDGAVLAVKSEELVPGDVVLFEAGDAVPADVRILESASLKIEEAALTGESVPVSKRSEPLVAGEKGDVLLGDRKNMAFMGSSVSYGRGKAVVVRTGMDTEMGKIAGALAGAKDGKTPLQKRLARLSRTLTILVVGICAFLFLFTLLRAGSFGGAVLLDSFMIAVSLAVAAIPEGLAAVVTILLSMGVTKMAKQNAVIRKLTAVETLGCTQVICSDKTGTLTQNKMTVVSHYGSDEALLARAMALCSDSEIDESGEAVGEPTENALVQYALGLSLDKNALKQEFPRVGEAPFDSMRKRMSTVHKTRAGSLVQFSKGAPDELLKCCDRIFENGGTRPITQADRALILAENKRMADQALRVLAAAARRWDATPASFEPEELERGLVFLGLAGMIDPVRPEVIPAIERCREAGIRPVMITGDHRDTAAAIAMQLGIIKDPSEAVSGSELDGLTDGELLEFIGHVSVYARVRPDHKVRIVKAWKEKGMVTAMTGDGVNDAPSIKAADIGIGMGVAGSDVTKNVADMVLEDDNFATIVFAVGEGRRIYDNIRKAIHFLLASNISEIVAIFTATLLGFTILGPAQILWINLITDTFPALALGLEEGEPNSMKRKPRPAGDGVFSGGLGLDIGYQGALIALITLAAYFTGHYLESGAWEIANSPDGMTMAFLTMSIAEICHSFNVRSQRGSVLTPGRRNPYLLGAMLFSLVLTALVIYLPFLSVLFGFEHISLLEFAIALLLAFSVVPLVELVKLIQRRKK